MASITGLGKIGLPRLSENMDPDEALLVLRLAEVGMEPHAQISGQNCGLPQQLLGNAEG